jgi:hypothetical protein
MNPEINRIDHIVNWLFRTADGKIVIAQFPNGPLWTWLGATILEALTLSYSWHGAIGWIGTAALAWWAYLEITQGVNGFRRILGSLVLIYLAVSRTHLI